MTKMVSVEINNHILCEADKDNKFYFYRLNYEKITDETLIEKCYQKYLVEKIRLGEILNYEIEELKFDTIFDRDYVIAKVEVSGIKITKDEEKAKQKKKARFKF